MLPKVSVIGAGNVGGLTAARLVNSSIADCVLVDINKNLALAKQFDIEDANAILKSKSKIIGTDNFSMVKDSSIVIITAGFPRKPGMTREDLLKTNSDVLKQIADKIKDMLTKDTIVIAVTNPLDIMTYFLYNSLGLPREKMFGMGGTLDSGRFANLISKKIGKTSASVDAMVIGAHDNTMVPLTDKVIVEKKSIDGNGLDDVGADTIKRGATIVSHYGTGSAYFAPSAAVYRIVEAIISNRPIQTSASVYLNGEYGLNDLCIGVPVQIKDKGIDKIIELELNYSLKEKLNNSAANVKTNIEILKKILK
ncbi:MAG: malate dehydrogenase [Candidatus Gygaella obscura]|nr:malate dehydrogenase [Candidatus Gygaella obscura]